MALGLILPVAAGAFDLTIAGTLTVSACFTAWALTNHNGVIVAAGALLLIGVVIGLANSMVVVKFKVDSFIGTLGMSSHPRRGGLHDHRQRADRAQHGGGLRTRSSSSHARSRSALPRSVYYAAVIAAIVIWWILEYTPGGRYLYAVGGNPVASRLAGVQVGRDHHARPSSPRR